MPHAEIEFIHDFGVEDPNPVGRPAVILVEVVRENSPAVSIPAGPSRRTKTLVVGCPPLGLPVNTVLRGRMNVKTNKNTSLWNVSAFLENIQSGMSGGGGVRQRKVA